MIDDAFFTDPAWCHLNRPLLPEEIAMDLSLRSADLGATIRRYAEAWCLNHVDAAWVEITEGPSEFPIACPQGLFAYLLCVRLPDYPHGAWLFILVDRDETLHGARLES